MADSDSGSNVDDDPSSGAHTATYLLSYVEAPSPDLQPEDTNQRLSEFSLLPGIDQDQIWESSTEPRLIEWGIYAPVPAMFKVYTASRNVGKKHYFFAHWSHDMTNVCTYIHQQKDIIYWKDRDFRSALPWQSIALPPRWIGRIFHLAMDIVSTGTYEDEIAQSAWIIEPDLWSEIEYRCPSLKILYIIFKIDLSDIVTWEDLAPIDDWDDINGDEEQMIVSVMESVEARETNKEWVPEVIFMREKPKAIEGGNGGGQ